MGLCSGPHRDLNIAAAEQGVRRAVAGGARWVVLPEVVPYLGPDHGLLAAAEADGGPTYCRLARLSQELQVYLFVGMIEAASATHVYNTLYGFSPAGICIAKYRKRHLFTLTGQLDETLRFLPGEETVVIDGEGWRVGLGICFDLRFAEFFQAMGRLDVVLLPSAFTYATGKEHWEILLRARAIENQCYVVAPNQGGLHWGERRSWGHSMVVDPWGRVLAAGGEEPEIVVAEISRYELCRVRGRIPMGRKLS